MKIIIHRVNTIEQLKKLPEEYGVEIDVRSFGERLILNHEPHQNGVDLKEYLRHSKDRFIIFNIKEAGIEYEIIELAKKYSIEDYFLLDVEFPFIYDATRVKNFKKIAIRFSEAEPIEMALAQTRNNIPLLDWVWIDTNTLFPINLENKKKIELFKTCLVCPERWGRPEDIEKYKRKISELGLRLDAVMTSLELASKWENGCDF